MIKIKDIVTEKRTGFKGEVINIRSKGCKTLFVVDFGRITRSFTRSEIESTLDTAVSRLGEMANKSSLFNPNGYPVSAGKTHFGVYSR